MHFASLSTASPVEVAAVIIFSEACAPDGQGVFVTRRVASGGLLTLVEVAGPS